MELFFHPEVVNAHSIELNLKPLCYLETSPTEKSARRFACLDVNKRILLLSRHLFECLIELRGHSRTRHVGTAVEMVDMPISLEIAIRQRNIIFIHSDQQAPTICAASYKGTRIGNYRCPGAYLFIGVMTRRDVVDRGVEYICQTRGVPALEGTHMHLSPP